MDPVKLALPTAVYPFIASALVALLAMIRFHRQVRYLIAAAAPMVGLGVACVVLIGRPAFPPVSAEQALTLFLAMNVIWATLAGLWRRRMPRAIAAGLISASVAAWMVKPLMTYSWSIWTSAAWLGAVALAAAVITWFPAGDEESRSPWEMVWIVVLLGITALALAASGSLLYGQVAGALAAATAPLLLFPSLRKGMPWSADHAVNQVLILLLLFGAVFSELPLWGAFMLWMSRLGIAVGSRKTGHSR